MDKYKSGFGTADVSYWLGLDNIHSLTTSSTYSALIYTCCGTDANIETYDSFSVSADYKLSTSSETGNNLNKVGSATSMKDNGASFSTLAELPAPTADICTSAKGGGFVYSPLVNLLMRTYYVQGMVVWFL